VRWLLVLLSACACERGTWYSRTAAGVTTAMFTCDYAQTMHFSDGGRWVGVHEADPVLGRDPSATTLTVNTLVGIAAGVALSEVRLPRWAKAVGYVLLASEETLAITINWHLAPACGAE
jgi:hypothetical protein